MMKSKSHSGFKKRFSFTSTGKISFRSTRKRHNMIKRSSRFIRQSRNAIFLSPSDRKRVSKLAPYT